MTDFGIVNQCNQFGIVNILNRDRQLQVFLAADQITNVQYKSIHPELTERAGHRLKNRNY